MVVRRAGRRGVRVTDMNGNVFRNERWEIDLPAIPNAPSAVDQLLLSQVIYREPPNLGCGTGQNTTNGVAVQLPVLMP